MTEKWDRQKVLDLARGFMPPCVLAAGVSLDLFTTLGRNESTAAALADGLAVDRRGLTILLDALAAMGLLRKDGQAYSVDGPVRELLSRDAPGSVFHAARHIAFLAPRWADIAEVVRTAVPYTKREGYEPPAEALESFIEAMDVFVGSEARDMAEQVDLNGVSRLLDVGGGPGTHTIAFLQANPGLSAVLFDRPEVIEIARRHVAQANLTDRVELVAGDFYCDALPDGCQAAWVSAVIHMNSRRQNCELFEKVSRALSPGGKIFIRDHVMDSAHTTPASGALFAINMLVSTAGGGTYSLGEISEDLQQAGFQHPRLLRGDAEMSCVATADLPA